MNEHASVAAALAASIRLGYEVERDDPNLGFDMPSEAEINWLGAWLASEGWVRPPGRLER